MPLDSPEAYELLAEHLKLLDPALDEWSTQRSFERHWATGRYPERRYYRRVSEPFAFLSVALQKDDNTGEEFSEYRVDLPYCIVLGFHMPRPDNRGRRVLLAHHVPFHQLKMSLPELLLPVDDYLRAMTMTVLNESNYKFMGAILDHATGTELPDYGRWL